MEQEEAEDFTKGRFKIFWEYPVLLIFEFQIYTLAI